MKLRGATRIALLVTAALIVAGLGAYARFADRPQPHTIQAAVNQGSICSVGDILLGDAARNILGKNGYEYPFMKVARMLASDLLIGNLEGPITEAEEPYLANKAYVYKQAPQVAEALRDIGFDMLALGNNHALDHGPKGLHDTHILSVDLDLIATDNRRVKFQPELVGTREARRAWAQLSIGFNAAPSWYGSTARITLPP